MPSGAGWTSMSARLSSAAPTLPTYPARSCDSGSNSTTATLALVDSVDRRLGAVTWVPALDSSLQQPLRRHRVRYSFLHNPACCPVNDRVLTAVRRFADRPHQTIQQVDRLEAQRPVPERPDWHHPHRIKDLARLARRGHGRLFLGRDDPNHPLRQERGRLDHAIDDKRVNPCVNTILDPVLIEMPARAHTHVAAKAFQEEGGTAEPDRLVAPPCLVPDVQTSGRLRGCGVREAPGKFHE